MNMECECEVCGKKIEFGGERGGGNRKRCKPCSKLFVKIVNSLRAKDRYHGVAVDDARREWYNSEALAMARDRMNAKETEHPCPYCGTPVKDTYAGKSVRIGHPGYCGNCRNFGYDELHIFTGKTNGWDRPKTGNAPLQVGWRGRPVAGGSCPGVRFGPN